MSLTKDVGALLDDLDARAAWLWTEDQRPEPIPLYPRLRRQPPELVSKCEGCDVVAPCWFVDGVLFCVGCVAWYRSLPPQGTP